MPSLDALLRSLLGTVQASLRPDDPGASRGGLGRCPACDERLTPRVGLLGEAVCASCQGRFLEADAAEGLLSVTRGLDREMLIALARDAVPTVPCPSCGMSLGAIDLGTSEAEICRGCGGLWLVEGALAALSERHLVEVPADAPPARPLVEGGYGPSGLLLVACESPPPTLHQVKRALGEDVVARRGGILVGGGVIASAVPPADAPVLTERLLAAGMDAVTVPAGTLRTPFALPVRRLVLDDEGFAVGNYTGALQRVPWRAVQVAEVASLARPHRGTAPRRARTSRPLGPPPAAVEDGKRFAFEHRDYDLEPTLSLLAEVDEKPAVFRIDGSRLDYASLGDGRLPSAAANFRKLASEILERSGAARCRGAEAFIDDDAAIGVVYTRPDAMDRELAWLRWVLRGGPALIRDSIVDDEPVVDAT